MCWYLWDFFEGLMQPLGKLTLVGGQLSLPLHPWKQNVPWFASSHLCLPPHLLTLPPDLSASAWLPSSPPLTSKQLGLLLPICAHHLIRSPFLHRVCLHGWLAGGLIHRWFGCSSNVSHQ